MPINKNIFIRDILQELEEENVAVFAGAGLSMPVGYVGWEELLKPIAEELNIDINHIIRHYDVNGKICPGITGWNLDSGSEAAWFDFKNNKLLVKII